MTGELSKPKSLLLSKSTLRIVTAVGMLACTSAWASITTTLGTRETTSQPNPPITSNADAHWSEYSRPADYPRAVTLPLQFITTPSGEKLAALVSVPADAKGNPVPGPFPVILTQNAYRIDVGNILGSIFPAETTLMIGGKDKFMIRRGYINVAVDVLGTGMSSGVTKLMGAEEQTAYGDVVNWITQQPWCDGNIGVAGTSYLGITSLRTAEQGNPAVKAAFAVVPMGDAYRDTVGPGGMLNAFIISLWLPLTQNLSVANGAAIAAHPDYADLIEANNAQHIQAITDWYLPTLHNALNGVTGYATDDGDFWAVRSPLEHARDIKVPTFIVGGSADLFQRGEPLLYEQLKRNVNAKLLIVPGAHVEALVDSMLNHDNRWDTGAPDSEQLLLRWFDQYLKGIDTGAASMPNVTQYVEGYGRHHGRYTTTTDWPDPRIIPTRYYLHGDMSLSTSEPTSPAPDSAHQIFEPPAPKVFISSPDAGPIMSGSVTTHDGGACSNSEVQWSLGIYGILPFPIPCHMFDNLVERRQHALIYDTAPFTSNFYFNGPIEADVWMSATNTEAALAIRVDDVDRYGRAIPLTTGLQSAAFRAVDTSRSRYIDGVMIQPWHPFTVASKEPLVPGQPVLVRVEIFPAAALLRPGHRLRIAISSSNQAEGIWPAPDQAEANGNVTTIFNDSNHPSSVVLPTIPASVLN